MSGTHVSQRTELRETMGKQIVGNNNYVSNKSFFELLPYEKADIRNFICLIIANHLVIYDKVLVICLR